MYSAIPDSYLRWYHCLASSLQSCMSSPHAGLRKQQHHACLLARFSKAEGYPVSSGATGGNKVLQFMSLVKQTSRGVA